MSDTEDVLVRLSQSGNRPAFEELVRRTARLVFSRIYLETGDPHRTEDLVQETFLVAWRSIRQVTEPSGFRTWLLSVASTTVIDHRRREGRKKRSGGKRQDESVLLRLAADSPPPDEEAEQRESRQRVLEALRELPEEYRMPLTLRYLTGADYQTIERELSLSNGSLRGLLNRGMALLRERVGRVLGESAPLTLPQGPRMAIRGH